MGLSTNNLTIIRRFKTGLLLVAILLGLFVLRNRIEEPLNTFFFGLVIPLILTIAIILELAKLGLNPILTVICTVFGAACGLTFGWLSLMCLVVVMIVGFSFKNPKFLIHNLTVFSVLGATCYAWLALDKGFDNVIAEVVVGAAIFDTFSYLIGSKYGRKKLVPTISPNKTLEGFLGGIMAFLLFKIVVFGTANHFTFFLPIVYLFGDLLKSRVKRAIGIKDFSTSLGVHGGVLDRLDSHLAGIAFAKAIAQIGL